MAGILIAFAGKTGTTDKCARLLQEKIPDSVVCDLNQEKPKIEEYDAVILGSSIRMGMIHKSAKEWFAANRSEIMGKPYALFLCNGFAEQAPQFLLQNYGEEVIQQAVASESFGGEMDLSRLKGMDKFIAKAVINANKKNHIPEPVIIYDKIVLFSEKFLDVVCNNK